jgi:uncharacterized protein YbaA (DUF1428 family)
MSDDVGGKVFASIYIYRVPRENAKAFLRIQREVARIYREHGALDDETWGPVNLEAKYGCDAFESSLALAGDECVFIGLSRFRDQVHHKEVMEQADSDPRINELYGEVIALLDVGRIVRGEFERMV